MLFVFSFRQIDTFRAQVRGQETVQCAAGNVNILIEPRLMAIAGSIVSESCNVLKYCVIALGGLAHIVMTVVRTMLGFSAPHIAGC